MKIKRQIILLIVISLSINIAHAEIYHEGSLEYDIIGDLSTEVDMGVYVGQTVFTDITDFYLYYLGESQSGVLESFVYEDISTLLVVDYELVPINVGCPTIIYDSSDNIVGYGSVYIHLLDESVTYQDVRVTFYFENMDTDLASDTYRIEAYTEIFTQYFSRLYTGSTHTAQVKSDLNCLVSIHSDTSSTFITRSTKDVTITYYATYEFRNDYDITITSTLVETNIYRNVGSGNQESEFIIRNSDGYVLHDSGYLIVNETVFTINDTAYYYIKPKSDGVENLIYSTVDEEQTLTRATLDFNDTSYNISETMEFEYTNLNELDAENYTYDLQFYHYINPQEIVYDYNVRLRPPIGYYEGTGYVNTAGWIPNKLYYGIIRDDLNYKSSKTTFLNNVQLSGYVNLTYSYEFIMDSCTGDYCSHNNGDVITISYNSYTDQNILILDQDLNIVQQLNSVIGIGTFEYTIPFDDKKEYEYPGWSIVMGSLYDNITVFWLEESQYVEYVTDDEYTDQEDVEENIQTLQESVKPIMELIIGCSGIIIENPDYDDNGIVGADELDQWFNGIIGLLLVIVIYIFYKGLKDR